MMPISTIGPEGLIASSEASCVLYVCTSTLINFGSFMPFTSTYLATVVYSSIQGKYCDIIIIMIFCI